MATLVKSITAMYKTGRFGFTLTKHGSDAGRTLLFYIPLLYLQVAVLFWSVCPVPDCHTILSVYHAHVIDV